MEHPTEPTHTHEHGVSDHDAHHVNTHVKGYLIVGAGLGFCTVLTVWLSYFNLGSWNIVAAMALATFKVGLVAAVFMHLKSERWTIYRILLITVLFAIGLFALTGLAFHDPIRY
jgi:cytochrome c oxidase subunit 4